eukprot:14494203-Heterocapsa_arctica.AAC.1
MEVHCGSAEGLSRSQGTVHRLLARLRTKLARDHVRIAGGAAPHAPLPGCCCPARSGRGGPS